MAPGRVRDCRMTLAELAASPHAADDPDERAGVETGASTREPLPFDGDAARLYGRMFAAARAAGQTSRSRLADPLIAATAAAASLPVYTRNPSDFDALKAIITVVAV